jgi:hypothetical protein
MLSIRILYFTIPANLNSKPSYKAAYNTQPTTCNLQHATYTAMESFDSITVVCLIPTQFLFKVGYFRFLIDQ